MKNYDNLMQNHRFYLHQYPELGLELPITKAYVLQQLQSLGFFCQEVATSGIIAYKNFNPQLKSILFRADMDALMQDEQTGLAFTSKHTGKMHACGHDGHMSLLLGFAAYISNLESLKKNIILVFQPGEEEPGGAEIIMETQILQSLNIEYCIGSHIFPGIEEGLVGMKSGPQMAKCIELDLSVKGKSAHGAMPHLGTDALLAFSHFHTGAQSIISRRLSPDSSSVISIGTVTGGSARNIIMENLTAKGTIRTFSDSEGDFIKNELQRLASGIALSYNVSMDLNLTDLYPAVYNDPQLYEEIKSKLPPEWVIQTEALMTAEDFSYYQALAPSMFFLLGSHNANRGFIHPLHSNQFNFSQEVLSKGLALYAELLNILEAC